MSGPKRVKSLGLALPDVAKRGWTRNSWSSELGGAYFRYLTNLDKLDFHTSRILLMFLLVSVYYRNWWFLDQTPDLCHMSLGTILRNGLGKFLLMWHETSLVLVDFLMNSQHNVACSLEVYSFSEYSSSNFGFFEKKRCFCNVSLVDHEYLSWPADYLPRHLGHSTRGLIPVENSCFILQYLPEPSVRVQ